MDSFITNALTQLGRQFPTLAVYVVGIVLAIVLWKRLPMASWLVFLGLAFLLVSTVAFIFLFWFIMDGPGFDFGGMQMTTVISILFTMSNVTNAVGIAILVAAAFAGRKPTPPRPLEPDPPVAHAARTDTRIRP